MPICPIRQSIAITNRNTLSLGVMGNGGPYEQAIHCGYSLFSG